jgi:DNA-binding response OmpR family regulator
MSSHIIVIDDTPEIVDLYNDLLCDEGYTVVATFAEPPDTAEEVGQHHPDLVIMDWFLGAQGTGLRTLKMLRCCPTTEHVPVLICTAARQEIMAAQTSIIECKARVLHKPFVLDDLLDMLREMLAEGMSDRRGATPSA